MHASDDEISILASMITRSIRQYGRPRPEDCALGGRSLRLISLAWIT